MNQNNSDARATILVIDDDDAVREYLRQLLEEDYQVLLAENGVVGEEVFIRRHPCVVITDIVMPDKDGLELIPWIRKTDPTVPIICISGGGRYGNHCYLEMASVLGAQAVLKKPFSSVHLLAAVRRALSSLTKPLGSEIAAI